MVRLNEDVSLDRLTEVLYASGREEVGPKEDPIEVRVLIEEIRRLRGLEALAMPALRMIALNGDVMPAEEMADIANTVVQAVPGAGWAMNAGPNSLEAIEEERVHPPGD